MKTLLLVALTSVLLSPIAVMAQDEPTSPPVNSTTAMPSQHHGHGGWMKALRSLGLSSDQWSRIKLIAKATREENRGVTDTATRRANNKAMRSQIEAVLTPAQQTQLFSEVARMRSERNGS